MAGDFKVVVGVDVEDSRLDALKKEIDNIESNPIKIKLDTSSAQAQLNSLLKGIGGKGVQNIKMGVDTSQVQKAGTVVDKTATKMKSKFDRINLKFETHGFESDTKRAASAFSNLANKSDSVKNALREHGAAYRELKTVMNGNKSDTSAVIAANDKYEQSLKKLNNELKMAAIGQKRFVSSNKLDRNRQLFSLQIDRWLKDNSAAASKFGSELENLQMRVRACNDAAQFNNLKAEFSQITTQAQLAGKTGLNFADRLEAQFAKFSSYIGVASAFMYTGQAIRSMAKNVLEVDTAMTELYRVTDLTATQYDGLYDRLVVSAKEYGATLTDLISATADWSRAGFGADVAAGLAEVTTMYQHIADLDYQEAFENLMTSYKGFEGQLKSENMFGDDTIAAVGYIGDILNELDNNYAVTAAGVGEAMKRSASALSVAGNSIQETAA